MSLKAKDITRSKKISTVKEGIHLVVLSKLSKLKNAAGELIQHQGKHDVIVVEFKNDKNEVHYEHYPIDGDWRQKNFRKMLIAAQAVKSQDDKPIVKDCIGKRLYIYVKKVAYVNGDEIILEDDGSEKADYYVFKVSPFIEDSGRPAMTGDPAKNDGEPSGQFIDYRNISVEEENPLPQTPPSEDLEEPSF